MSKTETAEPSVHNDHARETATQRVESNFSSDTVRELHASYNDTVGINRTGAGAFAGSGGDGSFPSHSDYSFYNSSAYGNGVGGDRSANGVPAAGVGTDSSAKVALTGDTPSFNPADQFGAPNYYNDYKQDASKFAYGTALTDGQSAEGKDKLQRLTEEMYRTGGKDGLKALANDMSKDAVDKFGDQAFDQAAPAFDSSVAKVKATSNADGSTQVQWDFAQPNSPQSKSVIFQLPKAEPSTGGYQEVFPDSSKPTWKV